MDISGNFILVGFSRISKLVESGGFFIYKVGISGNFRLVDPSRFFRF